MRHVFLKETKTDQERKITAYSTLMGLLDSASLRHLYHPIRYVIVQTGIFKFENITITKVPFKRQKHDNKRK